MADALSRRSDHQVKESDEVLQGKVRTREEFLASIRLDADVELESWNKKGAAERRHECSVCALRLSRQRVRFGPDPDPALTAAQDAQRQRDREAATKVVPPAPGLPKPNRKGAIVMPTLCLDKTS